MNTLYPFQQAGIDHLVSRDNTMLNDEQGLGKTIQAIGALNHWRGKSETEFHTLVVCPASLRLNWFRELNRWLAKPAKIFTNTTTTDILPITDILITSYGMGAEMGINTQLLQMQFDLVIFDEAHYLKNGTAKTTRFFLGFFRKNYQRAIALTGTPVKNRPIELYTLCKSLSPETIAPYLDKLSFGRRFCKAWQAPWGWDYRGASNLDDLNARLKKGFMLRRTKAEVLPDLPPRTYQIVSMERNTVTDEIFCRQKFVDWETLRKDVELGGNANIGLFSEIRQELIKEKMKACLAHIDDLLEYNDKLILFTYHRITAQMLKEGLNWKQEGHDRSRKECNPVVVQGGMSDKKKQDAIDAFQNDPKCRIIICQMIAGGIGITLTAASTVVFVESSWCPADIAQAVDRSHRIGQDKPVLAQFLVVQDTIEEFVLATALEKVKIIQGITK